MRIGFRSGIPAGGAPAPVNYDDGTPLGLGAYTLYFDPYDYGFTNGDVLSAALTPRVGASVLTPTLSPTYTVLGIGGRGAIDFGTTTNAYLDGAGYAGTMNGHDQVTSGAIRFQRVGNEAGILIGWGRGSTTDQFFEIGYNSSGRLMVRKDGPSETEKTYTTAGASLAFTEHTVGWTIRAGGTLLDVYLDGVLVSDLTGLDIDTTDPAITNFRIGTTGRSTGGTDDAAGKIGQVCFASGASWTAQQHLDTHNYWVALQPPAVVGALMVAPGDSMTKCPSQHGWRGVIEDYTVAQDLNIDWAGSASDGNWANNQHSGYSGRTLEQIANTCTNEFGAGKPYPVERLGWAMMWGTNSLQDGQWTDVAAYKVKYKAALAALHAAGTSTTPTFRIVASDLPFFDPVHPNAPRADATVAAHQEAWDEHDAAHPSNKIFRASVRDQVTSYTGVGNDYLDAAHYNNTGNLKAGTAALAATAVGGETVTSYMAAFG